MQELIINAALTGTVPRRADNPYVPLSEDEIVADAVRCVSVGASILHLHVRYADESPAYDYGLNESLFRAVREACPGVIISGSTSGRTFSKLDERAAVLAAGPDMASLTLGSMNFPTQASVNAPATIRGLAARMRERGIMPELEVFDLGMADYARYLVDKGEVGLPAYANILLGSLGTASASAYNLATIVRVLPDRITWAAAGIGRFQLQMNSLAIAMGGHVRVGLEDNLWMDSPTKSDPASNLRLIERVVAIARANGRKVASPAEARQIIGLRGDGATNRDPAEEMVVVCDPNRLPEVYALRARVWIEEGAHPASFPEGCWTDSRDAHRMHWVVLDGDRIVACASLGIYATLAEVDEPDAYRMIAPPRSGFIAAPARVVVESAYRGRGFAQRLLDRQDDAARAAGAVLAVRQASPAMRRLLERRGWQYHGPGPADPRFPGVEFSVMALPL